MIDFLKIHHLPVKADKILNNDRLTFPHSNVATTGEILNRSQVAHWQKLTFTVRIEREDSEGKNIPEKVSLKGSPHKHFEGGTNYRDFYLTNIKATIKKLAETFDFDPQQAIINFLEVGVNIPLENDPTELIKAMVSYRNNPFTPMLVKGKGYGRICESQQLTLKSYNKSEQNTLPYHLWRFEAKIKRMKFLERFGLTGLTLADLTKPETYEALKKMLLEVWKGILIYDREINPESIQNPKDRELFLQGRYSEFWQDMDKFKRTRKKKRFIELAGSEKISNQILELIEKKCNQLTTFQPTPETIKMQPFNHFQETAKIEKMQPFNPKVNGYLVSSCIVTNLAIKHPAIGKRYLKQPDIKTYYLQDRETYTEKLESLLTEKWKNRHANEPLQKWFEGIAHKIRCSLSNTRRNPINNTRKSYRNIEKKGLKLWPTKTLADPVKLELIEDLTGK